MIQRDCFESSAVQKGEEMTDIHPGQCVAACAAGLEDLIRKEALSCGGSAVEVSPGIVSWKGSLETAYRMCLWSRYASRVLLQIAAFEVRDGDELYRRCLEVDWHQHLRLTSTMAVSSTLGEGAVIGHSHYCSLRVKDGIVDTFRKREGERPNVEKNRPDVRVHLHLEKETATLSVDLSGDSLHRRGYRSSAGIAPLKETLAAAIVSLSGWNKDVSCHSALVDPMCGSGTLLIEAALIWGDSAPGLSRKYYGFSGWLGHNKELWQELVTDAVAREEKRLEKRWPRLVGYDSDPLMVAVARDNITNAGLEDKIEIKCREIGHLGSPAQEGMVVTNLPYGERLSEKEQVRFLYSGVGHILRSRFEGWKTGLFLSDPDIADRFGIETERSYKLYNGPIACRLQVGTIVAEPGTRRPWANRTPSSLETGVDFANRLQKNLDKLLSWAEKEDIWCFRVYDRDLPDYNVSIDIYDRWVLVQEYAPPPSIDPSLARKRFSTVLHCVREIFDIGRDRVHVKRRSRQRGSDQYRRKEVKSRFHQVREKKCWFLVNFDNYVDTGLFLDHRPLRLEIGRMAAGKRFLNLFGYTGTATVHAAQGGAELTTTVDLSRNYLDWTCNNLALNGFSSSRHETVVQDCMDFVGKARKGYDIVFIDPPTFSNTKKKGLLFDVQRHHRPLIDGAMRLLEEGGTLFFSTNSRKFTFDAALAKSYSVKEITSETTPFDFRRRQPVHRCWKFQKEG